MEKTFVNFKGTSPIKDFVKKALSIKYFYIVSVFVCLVAAFLLNKYSRTVYRVDASIIVKDNSDKTLLGSNDNFKGVDMFGTKVNIEDEVSMLKSFALINATITNLNLEVNYCIKEEKLIPRIVQIYNSSPFIVNIDKSHVQAIDLPFYIEAVDDSSFRLSASAENVGLYNYIDYHMTGRKNINLNQVFKFNETITSDYFKFSITKRNNEFKNPSDPKSKYFFVMSHLEYLTAAYSNSLTIELLSPLSNIIKIALKGENQNKINDFLNTYLGLYLNNDLTERNRRATSTIDFIDSQISDIADSLLSAESKLKDYRTSNQVTDLSYQGKRIYDQLSEIETQRANALMQKRYYNYIIDYFKKNQDGQGLFPPSQMNVNDPIMNQLILEMISLNSQRAEIQNNSQKSLYLAQIENKIEKQKEAILENVNNNINTLNLSINELDYRSNKLNQEISKLPKTEIRLIGIERNFKLNDAIYTFLLQKRAEAEIAKASNSPIYQIVEPARLINTGIISPKKRINFLIALFLGLLVPTAFILLRDFFDNKVQNINDIEHISNGHPLLGVVYKNKYKTDVVALTHPQSYIAEAFRSIRTNLFLKNSSLNGNNTILVTSSLPKEGKSFVALNLASSISTIRHKTVIVDFDLRRPSLHTKFKAENIIGVSTYLADKAVLDDIILEITPNLHFIPAGPVLPNPAELIESENCAKLINNLKTKYEFVILDSPPIAALTDAILLTKYASYIVLLSRQNYTKKEILTDVFKQLRMNDVHNIYPVLNDVNFNKTGYGQYYNTYYSVKPEKKDKS